MITVSTTDNKEPSKTRDTLADHHEVEVALKLSATFQVDLVEEGVERVEDRLSGE